MICTVPDAMCLEGAPKSVVNEGLNRNFARLDGDHNRGLVVWKRAGSLVILGPQPPGDGLFDVGKRLLLRFPLRNATGKGRALSHNPPAFVNRQNDMK